MYFGYPQAHVDDPERAVRAGLELITILEAAGIQAPVMVNGVGQRPIEGVSMAYTWDKANANAKSTRPTQYFEMFGNRAIYNEAGSPPRRRPNHRG